MPTLTYLQLVQKILSSLVREGQGQILYERVVTKVTVHKRWVGEQPVLHYRRLVHTAIMREVWAKRVIVRGHNEARVIIVTNSGTNFYMSWTEPEPRRGDRTGRLGAGRSRAQLLAEYGHTATIFLALRDIFAGYIAGHAFLEVKNFPDLTRAVLQTERYQREHNLQLSQQIMDENARIKSLEVELRNRGTAVTTSDVVRCPTDG